MERICRTGLSPVTNKAANMIERFNTNAADWTLETYYPQLNKIISALRHNAGTADLDILNFLIGKKSLEDCKFNQNLDEFEGNDGILEEKALWFGGKEHFIKEGIAGCLNEILNGGYTGFWGHAEIGTDKLNELLLITEGRLPQVVNNQSGVGGIYSTATLLVEMRDKNINAVADKVAENIARTNRHNHMELNQKLGTSDNDLISLDHKRLRHYFDSFATYLGISIEEVPLYLETHPITVMYDQGLYDKAMADMGLRLGKQYACRKFGLKELCALDETASSNQNGLMIKHGAITSMPGVLIFGTKDCSNQYNKSHVHFGENIHVIGLNKPHQETDVYAYYKQLYDRVIYKACAENKVDCLVLNGVGDGVFANSDDEKRVNAEARLDALIENREKIIQCKMKIILTDYANNFHKIDQHKFANKCIRLGEINRIFLFDKDADFQGQALANGLAGSQYVGLVNASDARRYGCYFLTRLGDNTVEERIWNQMFIGAHYDAVVASDQENHTSYIRQL